MRWILLLLCIAAFGFSLTMAQGPSEEVLQQQLDYARASGASEDELSRIAGEANSAALRGLLNIVGWGSLVGFVWLSWPRKRKPPADATPGKSS